MGDKAGLAGESARNSGPGFSFSAAPS